MISLSGNQQELLYSKLPSSEIPVPEFSGELEKNKY